MRVKNAIKNIRISFIFFFITVILNFVSRAIFIKFLGANITGYNNLINSLLGFLNMAEMGIASAIAYSLYEPLKNKDTKRINEVMILFKYLYSKIGIFVIILGTIVSFSIPFFIKGQLPIREAYIYYFLLLTSNGISYFFTYKQTLIISDQKQFVVTTITSVVKIIKVIFQIILLIIFKSYLLWTILEIAFSFISYVLINKKVKKIYPEIDFSVKIPFNNLKENNTSIIRDIKNIFFHKVSSFIVYQTDSIVISAFSTLVETAMYSNYMMIINNILALINTAIGSITASVGNLVSEKDSEKNYIIFKKLHVFDNIIALFICSVLYAIINQFIVLWVGKEFVFNRNIIIVLLINLFFQISRGAIVKFKTAFGLFWDIIAPIIEGGINLAISVILIKRMGIIGVFIGTLISNIVIIFIWHPIMVFKYGFREKISKYYVYTIKILSVGIMATVISNLTLNLIDIKLTVSESFVDLVFYSSIVLVVNSIIFVLLFLIIREFRELLKTILLYIKNKI